MGEMGTDSVTPYGEDVNATRRPFVTTDMEILARVRRHPTTLHSPNSVFRGSSEQLS